MPPELFGSVVVGAPVVVVTEAERRGVVVAEGRGGAVTTGRPTVDWGAAADGGADVAGAFTTMSRAGATVVVAPERAVVGVNATVVDVVLVEVVVVATGCT